jgi:methyl-accepting chemotaxis protein
VQTTRQGFRMKNKRKKFIIEGNFQARFILRFVLLIVGITLLSTGSILLFFYLRQRFGVPGPGGIVTRLTPEGTNDLSNLFGLVLTPLIAANLLALAVSVPLSLLYSHKIAGPIYRLQQSFDLLLSGEMNIMINLRRQDEFKYLADKVNALIDYMRRNVGEVKLSYRLVQKRTDQIKKLANADPVDMESLKKELLELERFFSERREPFSY